MAISGTNKTNMTAGLYVADDFEKLTISNAAKSLTAGKYTKNGYIAKRVMIGVENGQLRYRYDGGTPTATTGMLMNPMDILVLIGSRNIKNFKAIRKTTTNSQINITYEF